ncbi:hypothetical protein [Hahella ganghwensis]|uniref:hypothetical protein n=1 Tax=Hahella ganghwensis TaxID=286420 RepID=UPI00037FC249|nr:hypothetical protein [Hahella ganghwensis]
MGANVWKKVRSAQVRILSGIFLFAAMLLAGCSQAPVSPASDSSVREFSRYHHQMAQRYIDSGSYFQALQHVEMLAIVEPYNSSYQKNIEALRSRIKKKKQQLVAQSEASRAKGDDQSAYYALLQALSLDPEDASLLPPLQQHYAYTLRGEQERKQANYVAKSKPVENKVKTSKSGRSGGEGRGRVERASLTKLNTSESADPLKKLRELLKQESYRELISEVEASTGSVKSNAKVKEWLAMSHLALAKEEFKANRLDAATWQIDKAQNYMSLSGRLKGELKEVCRSIALALLEEGKGLLRTDLEKAVDVLEKAKKLDEQDGGIQLALERAYRLKGNLDRIKGNSE